MKNIFFIPLIISLSHVLLPAQTSNLQKVINDSMAAYKGTCVFVDCMTGEATRFNPQLASRRLTPCSTFKIWNTLIGIECRLISSPDAPFYKWDGKSRFIPEWNKDQTLREAFRASCVPAFQNLARKTGLRNMRIWLDTIGYGDGDISSGIDQFWLPVKGKKSILISPDEQALLIRKLVRNELPFSRKATSVLKEIMEVKKTSRGTYYGKTGTGADIDGDPKVNIAWFVGYVESKDKIYSFACLIKGEKLIGKDAGNIIEGILLKTGML